MLSILIVSSILGSLILGMLRNAGLVRLVSLVFSLAIFSLAAVLFLEFDPLRGEFQFLEEIPLIPSFGISYRLGVDGVSFWLVILTAFLTPLVILASFRSINSNIPGYYSLILLLEGSVIGAFCALDIFLFYIFWELMLVPMFFLIGIWGGKNRIYATIKFVLFTMIGSLLMLVAIIYLAHIGGSFNYLELVKKDIPVDAQHWLFAAFALAFLIKVPVFPFHTWLPDAHTEAPAGGSVILAGLLLKLGVYGLIRFNIPLFPESAEYFAPLLMLLGLIGIIHGAFAAASQPDMKRLVAYSSVSHMGFMILGIFSFTQQGIEGSILQMLNHALSTGALFFLIGMIYDQTHTREIADYGGMAKKIPRFAAVFLFTVLASAGLPGLNGFIGEFLILASTFQVNWLIGGAAVSGVVLGAWYLLRMYGLVFFGPLKESDSMSKLKDISIRETLVMLPLMILMLLLGVAPGIMLKPMEESIRANVLLPMKKSTADCCKTIENIGVAEKIP